MTVAFIVKLALEPSDLSDMTATAEDIQASLETHGFEVVELPHAWAGETRSVVAQSVPPPAIQPLNNAVPQLHVPLP